MRLVGLSIVGAATALAGCASTPTSPGDAVSAATMMAVMLPVGAVVMPIYGLELNDLNGQLGQLRLGEAPPSGLDVYLKQPPSHVTAKALDDGGTQLNFYINRDTGLGNTPIAVAMVENGIVTGFDGDKCALDGKVFRCHM